MTKEEEAALIAKRQADCEKHKQPPPRDTFIGNPAQCACCGMPKSKYELSLAPKPFTYGLHP